MKIQRFGVIGAGTMGAGIVQVCARAGFDVIVREPDSALVEMGLARLDDGPRSMGQEGRRERR